MPGNRLIAPTIDEHAQSRPHDAFFSVPVDNHDLSQGFRDVACRDFAGAVNRAAVWLSNTITIAPSDAPFEAIAYQGPNDLRYPILAVAASKVGKQLLFPFSLAPPPVKLHLVHSARCKYYLHDASASHQVAALFPTSGPPAPQCIAVPELSAWLLNDQEAPDFPYTKTWDQGKDDPWLIFHTSGTTGLPKLITYTNRMMTSFDVAQGLAEPKDKNQTQLGWHFKRRCYSIAPMSHFSGLCAALQSPLFLNTVSILGPPALPPSPPVIADILRFSKAEGFVSLPALLRPMTRQLQFLELLKGLDYVQWIGAALDTDTGDTLSKHARLCPAFGTTECGPYFLCTVDDPQDWAYYAFQSGQGIDFEPVQESDDLYELVFRKSQDAVWQQVFLIFPDITVYRTKDLFKKHPSKEGLWAYMGRSDDMVVLSNSANLNAVAVEEHIMTHPSVQMALVGGSGRNRPFAIVELTPAASEELKEGGHDEALHSIWPTFEKANARLSDYTRLRKEFVIITHCERGIVKSPKNSVMRGPTLKAFEEGIAALYSDDS